MAIFAWKHVNKNLFLGEKENYYAAVVHSILDDNSKIFNTSTQAAKWLSQVESSTQHNKIDFILVEIQINHIPIPIPSKEEIMRQDALAKLTPEEQQLLGLTST